MTSLVQTRTTVGVALRRLIADFTAAGIENPRLDARVIVDHALGGRGASRSRGPEGALTDAETDRIEALGRRRAAREPVALILGTREFWSLEFEVTPDTLIPRPESELVVELAAAHIDKDGAHPRILDLGTGTGCLLLSVLHERPNATGIGVDVSPAALAVACRNAARLGLKSRADFVQGDWAAAVSGRFDVVLANPPYVTAADYAVLAPEILGHEPSLALLGGTDGLDAYRRIAPDVARLLAPGGAAILECGEGQAGAVANLLAESGFDDVRTARDLAGVERCVLATN